MGFNPAESVDYGCQVCGKHCDDCTCPVCPECGTQGDPSCVKQHGLVLPQSGMIANQSDMLAHIGETTVESAKRRVYKDTACGASIEFTTTGIEMGSIVEGCDGDGVTGYTLKYPFSADEFEATVEEIEAEADIIAAEIEAVEADEIEES